VTKADGIDLAKNLAWLPRHLEEQERALAGEETAAAEPSSSEASAPTAMPAEPAAIGADAEEPAVEWAAFLAELRRRSGLHRAGFETWLAPLRYLDSRDGCLELSAPNEVTARWVRERHEHQIKAAAAAIGWGVRMVRIRVLS
jgi:hypothetical protein